MEKGSICYIIQPKDGSDSSSSEDDEEEEDNSSEESTGRILQEERVANMAARKSSYKKDDLVDIRVTPTQGGTKSANIKWLPDCGVRKTLVAEKHFRYMAKANQRIVLHENNIKFRPYSTDEEVPIIGKCKVTLKNRGGWEHETTIYVVDGGEESLLGKQDALALGIIHLDKIGKRASGSTTTKPHEQEDVARITPQVKDAPVKQGVVSGGQTQKEIDAEMTKITTEFAHVFKGMGRAKVDPIDIKLKPDAVPVTQGRREIPIHYRKPLENKIKELLKHDLIEGPLPAKKVKGWVHNPVIMDK